MKIYIVAHKDFSNPVDEKIYCPIQVGADINKTINNSWIKDNTGDNISSKNLSYNELTALYWIWKNSEEDIVGLCHYRRFFVTRIGKIKNLLFGVKKNFINEEFVKKIISKNFVVVHNKTYFKQGNRQQFLDTQKYPNDIDILGEVIASKYPEYADAYKMVMNGTSCHLLNMIIAKKEIIDDYCEWLFDVLFAVEEKLIDMGEKSFERRMGMLGERMLDIWLIANDIQVKEVYSINTERIDWKNW